MFFYNNILLLETFKFEDKICLKHGSYNLEKVLNLVYFLENYLISLLGLEKSLKFITLSMPDTFFCKIRLFCCGNLAHPQCKNL